MSPSIYGVRMHISAFGGSWLYNVVSVWQRPEIYHMGCLGKQSWECAIINCCRFSLFATVSSCILSWPEETICPNVLCDGTTY